MKKRISLLLCGIMAVSLLAGCGGGGAAAGSSKAGSAASGAAASNTLKFGVRTFSNGKIDPSLETNTAWNCMRIGVGESLFKFDKNAAVQPWLAEKCEGSDDHKTWTITLKKGVKFSNGTEMTATKVKESLDWVRDQAKNDAKREKGGNIKKYIPYEAEIKADDAAGTLTITLPNPVLNMAANLAQPITAIVNVKETKDFDTGIIGTGPYVVKSFKDQVGFEMTANTNYWDGKVPYENLSIIFMADASSKTNALKSGQVDFVENISNAADIKAIQDDPNFTLDIGAGIRTGFAYMNQKGVLKNKALRQAILTAIDNEAICKSNTIGGLYVSGAAILPDTLSYGSDKLNAADPYKYDPEKAKKILDDAGIKDTNGDGFRELDGKEIDLQFVSYESRCLNDFSDAFIQYMKEVGIKATPKYGSSDDQWSKLTTGEYDLNNNNWQTVPTGDPEAFLDNWYSKSEANYCAYKNDEYDKLYEELQKEMDVSKRPAIIEKMQKILLDDAAMIVDGYYTASMAFSKNVTGVEMYPMDFYWITSKIAPAK